MKQLDGHHPNGKTALNSVPPQGGSGVRHEQQTKSETPAGEHWSEYQVIRSDNSADLAAKLKAARDQGWRLQGGIAAGLGILYQAMVK